MAKITKEEKKGIGRKLKEFRKAGLESYAKYLDAELLASEGKEIRKAYTKYIKKEIERTAKQIAKLDAKLGTAAADESQ